MAIEPEMNPAPEPEPEPAPAPAPAAGPRGPRRSGGSRSASDRSGGSRSASGRSGGARSAGGRSGGTRSGRERPDTAERHLRAERQRQARAERRARSGRPVGSSELKRQAIVAAAVQLFARDGFDRTSVDAIADTAGVSKRTIYNHYGDKETLFLAVVTEMYDLLIGTVVELMDKYLTDVPADAVEQNLVSFACDAAMLAARSPERAAMIRLMMMEAPYFPELRRTQMRPQTITGAIAQRLTVLTARGLLDVPEPGEAANHLFSLTMGQMNNRSLFGAISLPDEDIIRMATSGARAFYRAYRPADRG
jgi:TetR/AcrR family transcriptional regulator, mexJK operon transcriptional repressor